MTTGIIKTALLMAAMTGLFLVLGYLLGGPLGLGTILFAILMGPTMQASLRLFRVSTDPSARPAAAEVRSEPA